MQRFRLQKRRHVCRSYPSRPGSPVVPVIVTPGAIPCNAAIAFVTGRFSIFLLSIVAMAPARGLPFLRTIAYRQPHHSWYRLWRSTTSRLADAPARSSLISKLHRKKIDTAPAVALMEKTPRALLVVPPAAFLIVTETFDKGIAVFISYFARSWLHLSRQ